MPSEGRNDDGPDGVRIEMTGGAVDTARTPQPDLEHVVVRYEERPHRCTIYAPDADEVARMSEWLSADYDALLPLDEWR